MVMGIPGCGLTSYLTENGSELLIYLLSAGITSMLHHTWFLQCLGYRNGTQGFLHVGKHSTERVTPLVCSAFSLLLNTCHR